ncbi:RHS repeat-associated core domain-containing protein [Frankia sp. ACN1ag]|uniref:RHS repeat-associated core domain-containing protein n=1 Tax=Frankia sp. ACN1ag TaxID=102891 RepID=UPI0037C0BB4E
MTYDAAGRLVSRTTAAGRLTWEYDADDRCVRLGQAGSPPVRHDYDDDGYLRSVEHPILGVRRIDRDADGRISAPGRTVERDAVGRITRVVDGGRELRFGYDAAGQLVTAEGPWGTQTLTWDLGGRLVAEDRGDPAGVLRSTYDAAGQLVERRLGAAGPTRYRYDTAGRRVAKDGPTGSTRYGWDALGRLTEVSRIPSRAVGGDAPEERTTRLVTDALGELLQIDGTAVRWDPVTWPGQVQGLGDTTYVRAESALGVIGPTTPDARADGQGEDAGRGRWHDTDWQGSFGGHDPWGGRFPTRDAGEAARGSSPDARVSVGLGYRGELAFNGLLWQRARVLDPQARSFLSPDPLEHVPGMPGAANPYHEAWNNPVGMLDPTGLRPLSDDAYEDYRSQSARNMFGKAWHNIQKDPWGSLAAAAVITAGVGLMFVPGGQAIGAGILIGAGSSAGLGLVTGNFDPTAVALSGIAGGVGGGVGAATGKLVTGEGYLVAAGSGAISGAAGDVTEQQVAHPGHLDLGEVAFGLATGGLGGAGSRMLFRPTLKPADVRFSQGSVGRRVPQYVASMRANGWAGDRIDVVRMPDGGLTSVDNRRVLAAKITNTRIQANIHRYSDPIPSDFAGRFRDTKKISPDTWGEAVENRLRGQKAIYRQTYPMGSPITSWNGGWDE